MESIINLNKLVEIVESSTSEKPMSESRLKEIGLSQFQIEYLVRKGAQSIVYNKSYRAQRAEQIKEGLALRKAAQGDPELAARLGLGTRA